MQLRRWRQHDEATFKDTHRSFFHSSRSLPPPSIPRSSSASLSRSPSAVRYCSCNSNSLKRVICIRWDIDDTAMRRTLFLQLRCRCLHHRKTKREKERSVRACKCTLREEKYRNEASRLRLIGSCLHNSILFAVNAESLSFSRVTLANTYCSLYIASNDDVVERVRKEYTSDWNTRSNKYKSSRVSIELLDKNLYNVYIEIFFDQLNRGVSSYLVVIYLGKGTRIPKKGRGDRSRRV